LDRNQAAMGGLARLPLRGQCRTLTGFPFHPAGCWCIHRQPVCPGTQSKGPAGRWSPKRDRKY